MIPTHHFYLINMKKLKLLVMKKKNISRTSLLFTFFLFLSGFVFAQTSGVINVSGAGGNGVGSNGNYFYAGTTNIDGTVRSYFDHATSSVYRIEYRTHPIEGNEWEIWESTARGGSGTVRYYNTSTSATIPTSGWQLDVTSGAITVTYTAGSTVTSISPTSGPTSGGTSVVITGTNLTGASAVSFGGTAATSYTVNSATQITATSPARSAGTINITVTTSGGTSATGAGNQFTYIAAPTVTSISPISGSTSGGTSVVITGTNYTGASAVSFGGTAATSYTVNSATQITATSPARSAGTINITVTTSGGISATGAGNQFTYIAAPTVTSISPISGPTSGGTSVVITGTNYTGATAVSFGGTAATGYTVNSATQITATSPAKSEGTIDITVTTTGGTSATVAGDQFTYLSLGTFTGATDNDWATATNWAGGSVPTSATDVTIPSGKMVVISATTQADCNNLTVTGNLTIESSASGTGSLIVSGTATGNVAAQRYMTGNVWHLVSSPVGAQDINAFVVTDVATNAVAAIDPKYGLAPYNNTTPGWAHFTTSTVGAAGSFVAGQGYEVLRTSDGTVTFAGTVPTADVSIAISKSVSGWNLIGNPFTSSLNGNSPADATNNFLTVNTVAIDASYLALYVWDAASSTYITVNHTYNSNSAFYVATGQAFFVYSVAGGSTVNFTEAMQAHQTGNIFKNAVFPNPSIKLIAERAEGSTSTNILYLEAMTTGLDPGYDAGRFSGGANSFAVYTHLVGDNSNLVDFDIQCLPDNNWDQIIPIGLDAPENTEVVFRSETVSLPTGVSVYLEDKVTGSFTAISGSGNVYTVKTDTKSKGTGRFFLHTKSSVTGIEPVDKNVDFTLIPRPQYNTLRIIGDVGKNTQLTVYDMAGRKLMSRKLNSSETNDVGMEGIKNGVYVVHISSTAHSVSKKISWLKN
jgi:hypothetical protein